MGIHDLSVLLFGCSGAVPASVADGTHDGGKDSAGGLQSLIGYIRSLGVNLVNGIVPSRHCVPVDSSSMRRNKP